MKVLSDIEFYNKTSVNKLRLKPVNTNLPVPSTSTQGSIYYNSEDNHIHLLSSTKDCIINSDIIEVTYIQLKNLRDNGKLIPGNYYHITDFVTTVKSTMTTNRSAGHSFDLIVLATSTNTLSNNATAIHHAGDTYFSNCNMSQWVIQYSLDPVSLSDSSGKGEITFMEDEHHNKAYFDFKNIQSLIKASEFKFLKTFQIRKPVPQGQNYSSLWCYFLTFIDKVNGEEVVKDLSVISDPFNNETDTLNGNVILISSYDGYLSTDNYIYNNCIKNSTDVLLYCSNNIIVFNCNDIIFYSPDGNLICFNLLNVKDAVGFAINSSLFFNAEDFYLNDNTVSGEEDYYYYILTGNKFFKSSALTDLIQ